MADALQSLFSNPVFTNIYNPEKQKAQKARYTKLHEAFVSVYGNKSVSFFSAPGRTEIGGNHTDHNNGRVIAASVDLDALACVARRTDKRIILTDLQYNETIDITIDDLEMRKNENHTVSSLIRGVAAGLVQEGFIVGGFEGTLQSEVFGGSGLSSSAALEVLIAEIFSVVYNGGTVDYVTMALVSQYAENTYFGKPCGLLDQSACAAGGMVTIDFEDPANPVFKKLGTPLKNSGFHLAVVRPGGDHAGLTSHYAAIPGEMKKTAALLGKTVCREITAEQLLSNGKKIRETLGDRALLRAYHFVEENARVDGQLASLEKNDISGFFAQVTDSGNSSWKYLQNISVPENPADQPLAAALMAADWFCTKYGGACRVHGGGFAGTIQVYVNKKHEAEFVSLMEGIFGKDCVVILEIREHGPILVGSV